MQARDFFDEPQAAPVSQEPAERESPREHTPREAEAPRRERPPQRDSVPPVDAPAPAPVSVYSSGGPPQVVFHAVSEHDAAAGDESHRPTRKRRQDQGETAEQAAALQLVETQAEAAPIATAEDELPRRTKPRRRRGAPEASEPLKLVETQPGAEATRPDTQP